MSAKLKKISDVERPTVGCFYLVLCAHVKKMPKGIQFWPIIGSWHTDEEIGFKQPHFHFDVRFFNRKMRNYEQFRGYDLVRVQTTPDDKPPATVWRRMKMQQEMPDFPSEDRQGQKPALIKILEAKFCNRKMECMTCPHRGFPLAGLPIKNGAVVCSGHGLKWDIKTGAMLPR